VNSNKEDKMEDTKSLKSTIDCMSIEGIATGSPAAIAHHLGMWWTADKSMWCDDTLVCGEPLYTKEEVLVIEMGILFLREVFRAMRPQKRERVKKHLRNSLEPGEDYWTQEAMNSGHAAKVVESHVEYFNL